MFCHSQKRIFKIFVCIGTLLILTGCLKRVEVVTRERVDQELTGNRGVIHGPVPTTPPTASPTREYVEWDIEVPTYEVAIKVPEWRREWHDKELWGNRGYLVGGPAERRPVTYPVPEIAPSVQPSKPEPRRLFFQKQKEEGVKEPVTPSYTTYTVQKGDTLGKISSKVYGTSRSWRRIYEVNRDTLKDPNRLQPNQVLRIPQEAEKEQRPIETIK